LNPYTGSALSFSSWQAWKTPLPNFNTSDSGLPPATLVSPLGFEEAFKEERGIVGGKWYSGRINVDRQRGTVAHTTQVNVRCLASLLGPFLISPSLV